MPGNESGHEIEQYRSGFAVMSRDGQINYFKGIQEAMTSWLERRFYDEYLQKSDLFKSELERRSKENNPITFSRSEELAGMNKLIDAIFEQNSTEFKNREEVESIFIDAHINGRLMRVGRLIERTFGKGSFRRVGEMSGRRES